MSSPLLHYITFHIFHPCHYLFQKMYFIKCALDFCKVRIKLLKLTLKGKQNMFPHHKQLSSPVIPLPHLHFKATMITYCHSFSTSTIGLHVDSAGVFGCCTISLVILVVPVDLCNLCKRSTECKHIMACICVGYSLISVHSYTTWCFQ